MAVITLADINKTLEGQNQSLDKVADGVNASGKSLDEFLTYLKSKDTKVKLEDQREKERKESIEARKKTSDKGREEGRASGFAGLSFPQAAGLAGLAGLGPAIFGTLARRGIPIAIATILADEIGDYVTSVTGKKELGEAAERAVYGGAIGSMFGKKFFVLGVALGAIMDDKVQAELDKLGKDIDEQMKKIGIELPTMESITTDIVEGLRGIRAAITGDFDSAEFKENWQEALALIASVSFMFSPRGTAGLALKALSGLGLLLLGRTRDIPTTTPTTPGGGRVTAPTAPPVDNKALQDQIKRSTPDKDGMVTSKSGEKYHKDTPQGKAIVASGEVAKSKLPQVAPVADPVEKTKMKNPRFAKFVGTIARGSALGALFGALELATILSDDTLSTKQKVEKAGGIFTGIAGAGIGTALGGLIGGPIGATLGMIGGSMGGRYIGQELMRWFLGEDPFQDLFQKTYNRNDTRANNANAQQPDTFEENFGLGTSEPTQPGIKVEMASTPNAGAKTDRIRMEAEAAAANSRANGVNAAINSGNTSVTNSNSQPVVMGSGSVLDRNDPFSSMLPTSP